MAGVHSMRFTCVGCQLRQVGFKVDVAQQIDDMAVPLDEHEGCICLFLRYGTKHSSRFPKIIAHVLVASYDYLLS